MQSDQTKNNVDGIIANSGLPAHSHKKVVVIVMIALILLIAIFVIVRYKRSSVVTPSYQAEESLKELKTTSLPVNPTTTMRTTELKALSKTSTPVPTMKMSAEARADFIKALDK